MSPVVSLTVISQKGLLLRSKRLDNFETTPVIVKSESLESCLTSFILRILLMVKFKKPFLQSNLYYYIKYKERENFMILSGLEIKKHINREIIIDPFDESRLNPNSYNLSLHNELLIYTNKILDMKQQNQTQKILIPSEGYLLEPGKLYLGRTNEFTKTEKFIPMLEGRSSIGRLGICIHVTAGFGDVGFAGYWTLELFCVQPVKIYPDVQIAQIYYHTITEPYERYTKGKYQNNKGIQASMLYKEFNI